MESEKNRLPGKPVNGGYLAGGHPSSGDPIGAILLAIIRLR